MYIIVRGYVHFIYPADILPTTANIPLIFRVYPIHTSASAPALYHPNTLGSIDDYITWRHAPAMR